VAINKNGAKNLIWWRLNAEEEAAYERKWEGFQWKHEN